MISVSIPSELILEILSRLPAKSIARFHCVSKQWASMLHCPYFTDLFLTRSLAQPSLLFAIRKKGIWRIFSVPQHQISSSSSLVVAAKFHMKFSPENMQVSPSMDRLYSCGYASGWNLLYGYHGVHVICNPNTGHYATLPYLKRNGEAYSFFGFDPIDKQFKVLSMIDPWGRDYHHKILTFGTGEMRWRKIKCSLIHDILSGGICINGVLYYVAETIRRYKGEEIRHKYDFAIVCFDVRSEKFKFIYLKDYYHGLINYKGKLGVTFRNKKAGDGVELGVWVLEDLEKQEWSKYTYTLRDDKFFDHYYNFVGVTPRGEIIISMGYYKYKEPFYVFYFNPEKNTFQRVEIQGFGEYHEAFSGKSVVNVFIDHVEDLKVNDSKLLKSSIYAPPYVKT